MKKHINRLYWVAYKRIVNAKRYLLNRRGDGVHSPYAFNFIRQVIRNPHPFDAFARLYDTDKAQVYRKAFAHNSITKRRTLELLFRATHIHHPQTIYYSGHILEPNSSTLVQDYLRATGYYQLTSDIKSCQLIIFEALPSTNTLALLEYPPRDRMLILNTNNPQIRQWLKKARQRLQAPIIFKTTELEIWIWRPNTTPGIYPVYY